MQAHQQRVVDEKTELDAKRSRLEIFCHGVVFQTLAPAEQNRLQRQAVAMQTYSDILAERIQAFE